MPRFSIANHTVNVWRKPVLGAISTTNTVMQLDQSLTSMIELVEVFLETIEPWLRANDLYKLPASGVPLFAALITGLLRSKKLTRDNYESTSEALQACFGACQSLGGCEPALQKKLARIHLMLLALRSVCEIKANVEKWRNDLNLSDGILRDRGPLYFASLELLVNYAIGGLSLSECKSGRNRVGFLVLYAFAIATQNGAFSLGGDQKEFATLLADFFMSEHQQFIAAMNVPGADGLKNTWKILTDDVKNVLRSRLDSRLVASFDGVNQGSEVATRQVMDGTAGEEVAAIDSSKQPLVDSYLPENCDEPVEPTAKDNWEGAGYASESSSATDPSDSKDEDQASEESSADDRSGELDEAEGSPAAAASAAASLATESESKSPLSDVAAVATEAMVTVSANPYAFYGVDDPLRMITFAPGSEQKLIAALRAFPAYSVAI